jgi:hypothetical protein
MSRLPRRTLRRCQRRNSGRSEREGGRGFAFELSLNQVGASCKLLEKEYLIARLSRIELIMITI